MPNVKRTLTHNGKTQTIPAWSRELGIPESTIRSRLDHLGMSAEEALTRPVDMRFRPAQATAPVVRPVPPLKEDDRGRGVARWVHNGKRHKRVFGPWGDPATKAAYTRWAAEWYASQGQTELQAGQVLCVAELIERCLDWTEQHYRKRGKPTSEVAGYRAALADLNELYGDTPAGEFSPKKLLALQNHWVQRGLSLVTCNKYLHRVVRCFSFGAGRGLVPASVPDALAHVGYLARGRTEAAEPEPVTAAPAQDVEKMLPHLHPIPERRRVLEAIVRVLQVTGMRPGEVLELRPEDIDRTREPWLYKPPSGGKALHHDKERKVWIGPKGRELLRPWLDGAERGQPVFRMEHRRRAGVLIPVPLVHLRDRLAAACEKAGVPVIRPNQLRHAKGTAVQRAYEDDAAVAAALGNTAEVSRQVYVDSPADAVARRIAEELG